MKIQIFFGNKKLNFNEFQFLKKLFSLLRIRLVIMTEKERDNLYNIKIYFNKMNELIKVDFMRKMYDLFLCHQLFHHSWVLMCMGNKIKETVYMSYDMPNMKTHVTLKKYVWYFYLFCIYLYNTQAGSIYKFFFVMGIRTSE